MLENKFTTYDNFGNKFEHKDAFHYRECLSCGEIFKYPNVVSGMDQAPIHCGMLGSCLIEITRIKTNGEYKNVTDQKNYDR